ncbi:MAG TPA: YicC/YloC family endoribonuclease [Thermoanaerobaculia bacterium]|nr:YicC/YloC family endoribonuclease [Thermoanaerobaculia bacterium]
MTLRSMTGFGRAGGVLGPDWTAELTVRSINHRFLDLTVRVRDSESVLEPVLRQVFARRLARGKVEVTLRLTRSGGGSGPTISVDERLLESLLARVADLSTRYPIRGELQARDLLTIPQLFSVESPSDGFGPDSLAAAERLGEQAADALVAMREAEGRRLAEELRGRIAALEAGLAPLAARRDEIVRAIAATLAERMKTLFADLPLDSGRLEQEAALAAERSDIAEELARLTGHLAQFRELLDAEAGPVGKKLEFLSQEILREINTLGSKARDRDLARRVLEMKSETEKIREQVQNLE